MPQHDTPAKDIRVRAGPQRAVLQTGLHEQGGAVEVPHAARRTEAVRLGDSGRGQTQPRANMAHTALETHALRELQQPLSESRLTGQGGHSGPQPQALFY